jgi:hypothetical protein
MEVQLHPFILAYGTLWLGPAAGVYAMAKKKSFPVTQIKYQ